MELNGNQMNTPDTDTDTNTAPLEILAEFLTFIMQKRYEEAMQHCKTILEYEPQNETVLSFIPLLNEKLNTSLDADDPSSEETDEHSDTEEDESHSTASSSSSEQEAINEGDISSELSPYDSSGTISSLSECDNEVRDNLSSSSLNQSQSSREDSSRRDVNSNSLDRSNSGKSSTSMDGSSGKDGRSLDRSNSSNGPSLDRSISSNGRSLESNASKDSQSSTSDVYYSLDSSSSNKTSSTSSSTKLGKETINRALAKTIENIRKRYGIRRNLPTTASTSNAGEVKNINELMYYTEQ